MLIICAKILYMWKLLVELSSQAIGIHPNISFLRSERQADDMLLTSEHEVRSDEHDLR
jgi:hypothetical protein